MRPRNHGGHVETTKSVTEIFDESPTTDSTEMFERLWSNMGAIRDRILARFELTEDPSVADLATFGGPTGPAGRAARLDRSEDGLDDQLVAR